MHEEHVAAKFVQGFYVLFYYTVIILGLTGVLPIALLYFLYIQPLSWPLLAIYLTWLFIDWRTPKRGGRKVGVNFIGSLYPFRCMRDYYPIKLVKTADLYSKRNYIFGYHPHGFMPDGLLISFGTNLLGFEEEFPGITPHIGAHSSRYLSRAPLNSTFAKYVHNLSRENEFHLHVDENSFSYERLCTHFEKEA